MVNVFMRRRGLLHLAEARCAEGYSVRRFGPGDDETWTRLMRACFPEMPPEDDFFVKEFASNPAFDPTGVFFVEQDGHAVASAMAWPVPDNEPDHVGQLHWVACLEEHRRCGLGRLVCLLVLERFGETDKSEVMLETQPYRHGAIRLYRELGFEPEPRDEEQAATWAETLAAIEKLES